jgi:hypothetical protein
MDSTDECKNAFDSDYVSSEFRTNEKNESDQQSKNTKKKAFQCDVESHGNKDGRSKSDSEE